MLLLDNASNYATTVVASVCGALLEISEPPTIHKSVRKKQTLNIELYIYIYISIYFLPTVHTTSNK